jgi:DNA modification methylase
MITITETLYKKMPDDIKACFNKLPNPSSEEVRECFPETKSVKSNRGGARNDGRTVFNEFPQNRKMNYECGFNDSGNASRFFKSIIYQAKASKSERNKGCEGLEEKAKVFNGQSDKPSEDMKDVEKRFTTLPKANNHPTVKPVALMEYLIEMVTPKGGTVLDPYMGSGTTGIACKQKGFDFIGMEMDAEYCKIAEARIHNTPAQQTLI